MNTQIIKLGGCLLIAAAALCGGQALAKPPTPVTCGSIITAPGEYYLAGDCTGPGITIRASKVHLKLNGHTMDGGPLGRFNDGLTVAGASNVHIEGPGTITNYREGIDFSVVSDSHVEQVTSVKNHDAGLVLRDSTNNHVNNSVFSENAAGVALVINSRDNHLNNNEANDNTFIGIGLNPGSTGNQINGNTALGNGLFDLFDANPDCDDNQWKGNEFDTANMPCID
jgi:parallel beta-helix repeat protein